MKRKTIACPMSDETTRRAAAAVLYDDDLLCEILLRLSHSPSSLSCASLVCKRWRRLATDPGFLRRFRPPLLGVYLKHGQDALFTPLLEAPDRIPLRRLSLRLVGQRGSWNLLGCRHGRVLIISRTRREVIVYDPIARTCHRVAIPREFVGIVFATNAAVVLCGDGDRGAHSSPFKMVLVATHYIDQKPAIARVYSSETRMWGDLISMAEPCTGYVCRLPSTFVGNALYWWLGRSEDGILEFDLGKESLAVIKRPPVANIHSGCGRIIRGEDGALGFAILSYPSFQMWDRKVDCHGVATWVLMKTVRMDEILGLKSRIETEPAMIQGYSEDAHAIFLSLHNDVSLFMVQLESMQSEKLRGIFLENTYHPFTCFYTTGAVNCSSH